MSRSRRLGAATALPSVALAAALVLTPATAFAAEGDAVATDATTGTDATTAVAPTETTVTPATTDISAPSTGTDETVPSDGDATSASGSETAPADTDAPVDDPAPADAAPVETAVPAEVAPADEAPVVDVPQVSSFDGAVRPGQGTDVYAEGFTPDALVHVTVTADGEPVDDESVFLLEPRFDEFGYAQFTILLPEGFPTGGTLTVVVTDDSGRSASSDLAVVEYVPAPVLEVPVGATAGVVTVNGAGGIPGGYALVEVFDGDTPLTDQFTGDPAHNEQLVTEPDGSADAPGFEVDVDPVPYETSGYAAAVVPVDTAGRFSAQFPLPAGDFAAAALTVAAARVNESGFPGARAFAVAPAVPGPPATTPGTGAPAALPVRPVAAVTPARATSLAYTGSEPSGALTWALGAVLAGAGALVASRLRPRRR
ncbi:hypothetical protein [Frigoribacterium sp. RIT-PI-h]|uniref:hypothetical protein n=1 Tax=Frigoribacterium sp. RIT-PI-h TaxID=1690245 RepID=UPI0006B8DFF1|nr:hypothetical protein [Frigoribacterium sp. RIT-PI-h]KPG75883.1 hypothetical protein AEQ27_15880 [Frigoribacterium sp. RIT-PI-h]